MKNRIVLSFLAVFLIVCGISPASALEMPIFFGDGKYPIPQNTLILDSNDTGGDVVLQFGDTLSEQIYWNNTGSTFTFTDKLTTVAPSSTEAGFILTSGANPSSPAEGDLWYNGTNLYFRDSAADQDLLARGPSDATYITKVAEDGLSAEQAMGALSTGIVKNTTTTGVQSIAVAGTDYQAPLTAGTDYAIPGANNDITSTTALTQITRSTGGAFDIAIGSAAGDDFTVDTTKFVVEGDTGQVGIGIADPVSPFYIYESTANVDATAGLTINNASTGDSLLQFLLNATQRWVVGIDNSDGDKFKISPTTDLNSDAALSIDPTTGAMSLLRSSLVYSGTARATRKITLVPEFSGATMTGDGATNSGIMTSDFCSNTVGGVPNTNTGVCNTASDIHNYYSWTTGQASAHDYDIWIRWRVPDNFDSWVTNPIYVYGKRTDTTNNAVTVSVYDTAGVLENASGTQVAGTTWAQTSIEAGFTGTYTAGSYMTILIHLVADTGGDSVQVGEISLDYLSNN